MDEIDRNALDRAIDILRFSAQRHEQIDHKLLTEGFEKAGQFAAYSCQCTNLNLKPWQEPPCWADENEPDPKDPDAQALLIEMLRAGLSRYEPDPLKALKVKS